MSEYICRLWQERWDFLRQIDIRIYHFSKISTLNLRICEKFSTFVASSEYACRNDCRYAAFGDRNSSSILKLAKALGWDR